MPSSKEYFFSTREKRFSVTLEEFRFTRESWLKTFRRKFELVHFVLEEDP